MEAARGKVSGLNMKNELLRIRTRGRNLWGSGDRGTEYNFQSALSAVWQSVRGRADPFGLRIVPLEPLAWQRSRERLEETMQCVSRGRCSATIGPPRGEEIVDAGQVGARRCRNPGSSPPLPGLLYHQMANPFTAMPQSAESSAREHIKALIDYVGNWEGNMCGVVPGEMVLLVRLDEESLKRFYVDLEANFQRLRTALKP